MAATGKECKEIKNSVLDSLIDLLPFEMHIPTYEFCGPGTQLKDQREPKNKLDEACLSHDLAYANNEDRRKADRILADKAFSRMFAAQVEPDERTAALIIACCMISKITFKKCFDRITKTLGKVRKQKKNNVEKKKKPAKKRVTKNA